MTFKPREERWQRRLEAILRVSGQRVQGFMYNLSNEGMEIRSRARLQMKDEVAVHILSPENQTFHYLSEVRWWRPAVGSKLAKGLFRYGLLHLAVDPGHDDLLDLLKDNPERRTISKRIEVELPVEIEGNLDIRQSITQNVSADGMFLHIEDAPPPYKGETIRLRFEIPETGIQIHTEAKVVHVLQSATAKRLELIPGIGLRLLDMEEPLRRALKEYVDTYKDPLFDEGENVKKGGESPE